MKRLAKLILWTILFIVVLPVNASGCNGQQPTATPDIDLTATEQAEAIAAGIASTMTAFAAETRVFELIMTQIATLTLTPPVLDDSLIQLRVRETAGVAGANVRRGPDTCFTVAALLQKGKVIPVLGRNADRSWYLIELANGMTGWVWADLTEFVSVDAANQVPLANNIPACPTLSRTATIAPPSVSPQVPSGSTPTTTLTIGPTPTSPLPPPPTCSYPPCITPTVGPTPTPSDPYPYP